MTVSILQFKKRETQIGQILAYYALDQQLNLHVTNKFNGVFFSVYGNSEILRLFFIWNLLHFGIKHCRKHYPKYQYFLWYSISRCSLCMMLFLKTFGAGNSLIFHMYHRLVPAYSLAFPSA